MTDEEISNLTDEQINVMVTKCFFDAHKSYRLSDDKSAFYTRGIAGVSYNEIKVERYCTNPSVMWRLIAKMVHDDNIVQILKAGVIVTLAGGGRFEHMDANPLRAAAIVYLKIKGVL